MKIISVNLKENPYNIYIKRNLANNIPIFIKKLKLGNFGIVITSPRVLSLYKNLIKKNFPNNNYKIIIVPNGEKAKTKKYFFKVIEELLHLDSWDKKMFIVCLGGGTVGDLGGFIAASYKRGIPYIQVPTTLLAQIDSSIGGKTGINLKEVKNILGAFYQPKAVLIDPNFLKTLPKNEIKQGIAEAIKYGVIKNKNFFYFLKNNHNSIINLDDKCIIKILSICSEIKAKIVTIDEKEKSGIRTILNFGHTLAHALEALSKYETLSHGKAVAVGMAYASYLSYKLKKCKKEEYDEILQIIKTFGLKVAIKNYDFITTYKSICYDKKFTAGKMRMVLLKKIGVVEVQEEIKPEIIKNTLKTFLSA